jgi:SET domain-containing protein 6
VARDRYDSSGPEAGGEDDNNDSGPNWCLPLAFVLLCERALAEHSAHAAYLAVLPDHAPVPMLWSTEQRRLLDGTELQEVLQDEWEMVHREWSNHVAPMVAAHPVDCPFTVEKYLAARSVITSRAFWMDHRHKEGLVPLCDLFNHSTGASSLGPHPVFTWRPWRARRHRSDGAG